MLARAADSVVIDASAAINAALIEDAFVGWDRIGLVAPSLLWSEAASGLSQLRWRREISDQQTGAAIGRLLAATITMVPSEELIREAAVIARELGWAKTYDAEYVILAQRLDAPLLTVDARLAARVRHLIEVLSPGEIQRR